MTGNPSDVLAEVLAEVLVLTVGDLRWQLGIEYALSAVAKARDSIPGLTYVIAGDGPERERVVYTAFDLGIEGIVRVVDAPPDMTAVRAAIWPSLAPGSAPFVDAAVRSNVPVIACQDLPGVVRVPARDSDALARALVEAVCGSS